MADTALYVLAGYDTETDRRLSALQNSLYARGFAGTHTRDIPQHITLGSFPPESEEALTKLLRQTAERTEAFEVTFHHVGIFGGAKVLFVAPDANACLLRLKEAFGSSDGWTPHTTMLIDEPGAIMEAVPFLVEGFSAFRGRVTTLHLYEFFPARHILSVRLG